MTASLRAFVDGLIDYAGLFPPASLTVPDAVATYARHLGSPHASMVSRFVCPIGRLDAFADHGESALHDHTPVRVAGLASPMPRTSAMAQTAETDGSLTKSFEALGWGVVETLEARLPDDLFDLSDGQIREVLNCYESALGERGMRAERIFYEIGRTAPWREQVERCVTALSDHRERGFKIRCGGATPDAYPSPREVADAISACAASGVPFKATAGLHRPVRHVRPESGIVQHGFFNVFTAGIMALRIDRDGLEELIDDRDSGDFEFSDEYLEWRGRRVSLEDIRLARKTFAMSYGSCDIDEPVADLEDAGLL